MIIKKAKINIFIMFFIILCSGFAKPTPVSAGMWGEDLAATAIQIAYDEIMEIIKSTITITLKTAANKFIDDRLDALLYGTTSDSAVITDYEDFITGTARETSKIYTQNVFTSITDSSSSYVSEMGSSVQSAVLGGSFGTNQKQPNIDQVVEGDVSENIFNEDRGGGPDAFLLGMDNEDNNPFGMFIEKSIQVEERKRISEVAQVTESNAGSGYKTTGSRPGSVWASLAEESANSSRELLYAADTLTETIVVIASNLVSRLVQNGIDKAIEPIDDRLIEVHDSTFGKLEDVELEIYEKID